MKILVIAPTPFFTSRGTHIRILEEALALEKAGHAVTIATYHIGGDIPKHLKSTIDVRRILRLLFWYKKLEAGPDWQKIFLDIMLIRKAFNLARTGRPDIIYGHLHEGLLIGWTVRKALFWRKVRLIGDLHGSLTKEMSSHGYLKDSLLKKLFAAIERTIDRLGDEIVTSSWENTEYVRTLRTDGRVSTLLDGVNPDHFRHLSKKESLRKEWGLPRDKRIFAYTGALIGNKGLDVLKEAIAIAAPKYPEAHFVLAGFPINGIEKWIRDQGLQESVTVISPLDYFQLSHLLGAVDFGVDPKGSETLQASGKILNYMAAGLPVVCFNRANNRNYLDEGGIYAPEFSGASLANAVTAALNLDENRLCFMQNRNRDVVRRYDWTDIMKTFLERGL